MPPPLPAQRTGVMTRMMRDEFNVPPPSPVRQQPPRSDSFTSHGPLVSIYDAASEFWNQQQPSKTVAADADEERPEWPPAEKYSKKNGPPQKRKCRISWMAGLVACLMLIAVGIAHFLDFSSN
mmetsp:Transcript_15944/g.32965  ORF Transcript_15944/g.32965 Transcript_15944/m.32965 type:complete len:123 (+) Transcript_15944:306-674(+)|eukprot:CAMPEP_0172459350 /NCGR_PEP_ID=MMETSP1065-20121228/32232_1 /TAXON_ID=265537 /ORGANISM="Amphiprora paludosa, Strain CCMP125" /LENGTH=122 /DNA_ID=CAMNT_0013214005 /DNA_START=279 /DNA_END=647 /DNA_ORIENTATION=+